MKVQWQVTSAKLASHTEVITTAVARVLVTISNALCEKISEMGRLGRLKDTVAKKSAEPTLP
jgi:hypothetical protein